MGWWAKSARGRPSDHRTANDCYALLDTTERFTKADVEYLLAEAKFIRAIPQPVKLHGSKVVVLHVADVLRKSNPHRPIKGLVVIAKARPSPPGIPMPAPSSVLEFYGRRIRGLNYEMWHDNPDGSRVKGGMSIFGTQSTKTRMLFWRGPSQEARRCLMCSNGG